jgi:hypothetical protein
MQNIPWPHPSNLNASRIPCWIFYQNTQTSAISN